MIYLHNICKSFQIADGSKMDVIKDFSLRLEKKDWLILMGSNGSGKSTLLNIIAGSLIPDEGSVSVNNINITSKAEHERSGIISRVFQNPLAGTASDLTVLENFRLASLRNKSKKLKSGITGIFEKEVKEKIAELNLGLENKLHSLMGSLSGGQRQALTLLMAVYNPVPVLLMDEPTAALDPKSSEVILNTASKILENHELTIIHVTHHLKEAVSYGNKLLLLQNNNKFLFYNAEEKKHLNIQQLAQIFNS